MRKTIVLISWAMILLLSISASPAGASSPPIAVNFEVETHIFPDGTQPNGGPFTASGPAVDAGMICATGQTIDVFLKAAGFRSSRITNFQVIKHFICHDGSGEFSLKLQVLVDWRGDNYNWVIISGTGNYVKLHGTGQGVGLPADYGVLDLFEGAIHFD